jgi:hypothetical protein
MIIWLDLSMRKKNSQKNQNGGKAQNGGKVNFR